MKTLFIALAATAASVLLPVSALADRDRDRRHDHDRGRQDRHGDYDRHRHYSSGSRVVISGGYYSRPYYSSRYGYGPHYYYRSYPYGYRPYYYGPSGYYHREAVPARRVYEGRVAASVEADVQRALAKAGYYRGPIDGDIGPMTRSAIRSYQAAHGLRQTGEINESLLRSLRL